MDQQIPDLLIQQIDLAFSPAGRTPNSIALNGMVKWTAGSTSESGSVFLQAGSDGSVTETWSLGALAHGLKQGPLGGGRECLYTDSKGKQTASTEPGCYRSVPWFSPWLATKLLPANLADATRTTQSVDVAAGRELVRYLPPVIMPEKARPQVISGLGILRRAATVEITYDAKSGLPLRLAYEEASDSEPAHAVPISVVFGEYGPEAGYVVPHHIQRYVQRSLQADIHISTVTAE